MTLSLIATLTWFLRTTITVAKNYTNSNQKKAKRCKKMQKDDDESGIRTHADFSTST